MRSESSSTPDITQRFIIALLEEDYPRRLPFVKKCLNDALVLAGFSPLEDDSERWDIKKHEKCIKSHRSVVRVEAKVG